MVRTGELLCAELNAYEMASKTKQGNIHQIINVICAKSKRTSLLATAREKPRNLIA